MTPLRGWSPGCLRSSASCVSSFLSPTVAGNHLAESQKALVMTCLAYLLTRIHLSSLRWFSSVLCKLVIFQFLGCGHSSAFVLFPTSAFEALACGVYICIECRFHRRWKTAFWRTSAVYKGPCCAFEYVHFFISQSNWPLSVLCCPAISAISSRCLFRWTSLSFLLFFLDILDLVFDR